MSSPVGLAQCSSHYGDGLPDFRRYRIYALSHSAADVIESVAGFLLDANWAGWETTVLTDDFGDPEHRALRVVGARVGELESVLAIAHKGTQPDLVAMSAQLYSADRRLQDWVNRMVRRGESSVVIWGDHVRAKTPNGFSAVHESSTAAIAFKSHALAAVGKPSKAPAASEPFHVSAAKWVRSTRLWTKAV